MCIPLAEFVKYWPFFGKYVTPKGRAQLLSYPLSCIYTQSNSVCTLYDRLKMCSTIQIERHIYLDRAHNSGMNWQPMVHIHPAYINEFSSVLQNQIIAKLHSLLHWTLYPSNHSAPRPSSPWSRQQLTGRTSGGNFRVVEVTKLVYEKQEALVSCRPNHKRCDIK